MRKIIVALLTMVLLAIGIGDASADGNGSCVLNGGTVNIHVNEWNNSEGSVSYISIASPVRLDDVTAADKTRARFYYEAYPYQQETLYTGTRYAYSAPVDGNGYWNYRIDVYYNAYNNPELRIGHVHINAEKYNSSSECYDDIYI